MSSFYCKPGEDVLIIRSFQSCCQGCAEYSSHLVLIVDGLHGYCGRLKADCRDMLPRTLEDAERQSSGSIRGSMEGLHTGDKERVHGASCDRDVSMTSFAYCCGVTLSSSQCVSSMAVCDGAFSNDVAL